MRRDSQHRFEGWRAWTLWCSCLCGASLVAACGTIAVPGTCDPEQDLCGEGAHCDPEQSLCVANRDGDAEPDMGLGPGFVDEPKGADAALETAPAHMPDKVSEVLEDAGMSEDVGRSKDAPLQGEVQPTDTPVRERDAAVDVAPDVLPDAPVILPKLALGSGCTRGQDCMSGNCVDQICCMTAACGTCEACAANTGVCVGIPAGMVDPDTCSGDNVCTADRQCRRRQGTTCSMNNQCASNFCIDGVCCESACDGECQACDRTPGRCTAILSGSDDRAATPCTGASACFPSTQNGAVGACYLRPGSACPALNRPCSTGMCVDGVCCQTACSETCRACEAGTGVCRSMTSGQDTNAATPCMGEFQCFANVLNPAQPLCKKPDGSVCTSGTECYSGGCQRVYRDRDGDGFGAAAEPGNLCGSSTSTFTGWSRNNQDCFDGSALAYPGQMMWFTQPMPDPDQPGRFDWNCNNMVERRYPTLNDWAGYDPPNIVPQCGLSRTKYVDHVSCMIAACEAQCPATDITRICKWTCTGNACYFPGCDHRTETCERQCNIICMWETEAITTVQECR